MREAAPVYSGSSAVYLHPGIVPVTAKNAAKGVREREGPCLAANGNQIPKQNGRANWFSKFRSNNLWKK